MDFLMIGLMVARAMAVEPPDPQQVQILRGWNPVQTVTEKELLDHVREQRQKQLSSLVPGEPTPSKGKVTLAPGQPCAIPLLNVLKGSDDYKMRMIPTPPADAKSQIQVPAPSCADAGIDWLKK